MDNVSNIHDAGGKDAMAASLDAYADWSETTAVYPKVHEAHYLALGFAEETGELLDALDRGVKEDVVAEAGDVCWYIARYCLHVLNIPFSDMAQSAFNYNTNFCLGPRELVKRIGLVCGVEKKRLRGGSDWSSDKLTKKHKLAHDSMAVVLAWVLIKLRDNNTTIHECLVINQRKLNARRAANTIKGDGDHR